ncbi:MAG TPA: EAL domain-containing protein [Thiothrix sp.]|nr:EAL domain-containing protein [Thiothrix sp.]
MHLFAFGLSIFILWSSIALAAWFYLDIKAYFDMTGWLANIVFIQPLLLVIFFYVLSRNFAKLAKRQEKMSVSASASHAKSRLVNDADHQTQTTTPMDENTNSTLLAQSSSPNHTRRTPTTYRIHPEKILNVVSSCVIACDTHKSILYINDEACELMDCNAQNRQHPTKNIVALLNIQDRQANNITEQVINEQLKHPERPFRIGQVQLISARQGKRFVNLLTNPILADNHEIEGVVLSFRDVTADRKVMKQLYRQASQDALTGLINRGSFEQFLEQLLMSNAEEHVGHVLAYIDLDHFKIVNDSCGHAAGDELLRQVSGVFQRHIRQIDRVARLGGDEFAILLQGCPVSRAIGIIEGILQELRAFRFIWQEKNFVIGASVGIVEFNSHVSHSLKGLLTTADKACYMAKKLGRDQYFVLNLEKSINSADIQLLEWGKYLQNALKNHDFTLFAQPIVSLQDEHHAHSHQQYEIFVRLPHDQNTFTPGSFMPEAERLGLTEAIDRWVLTNTFAALSHIQQQAQQQKHPHKPASVNLSDQYRFMINLSSQSVQNPQFADYITEQIIQSGLPAALFCFEVSEPVTVAHFAQTKALFTALRRSGCSCSLDDFGSGFSSLSYLRELPVNYLKIDGGFVQNLASNDIDAAMVRAVNQVGRVMNLYSIAESVEDEATLEALRRIGVDFAQGYFCGRPIPLSDLCFQLEKASTTPILLHKPSSL